MTTLSLTALAAYFQNSPEETFRWNQEPLNRANAVKGKRGKDFYPSLYVNMGKSYELMGNLEDAQRYYDQAADLGIQHEVSPF